MDVEVIYKYLGVSVCSEEIYDPERLDTFVSFLSL